MITALALCLTLLPTAARAEGGSVVATVNGTDCSTLKAAVEKAWEISKADGTPVIDLLGHEFDLTDDDNKYACLTWSPNGVIDVPANTTFQNGTFKFSGVTAQAGIFYIKNCNATFKNVDFEGTGYQSGFGVIYAHANSTVTLTGCHFNLSGEKSTEGGVLKGNGSTDKGTFVVTNCTFDLTNPCRVFANLILDMTDSRVTSVTDKTVDSTAIVEHAFRNVYGKIQNSTISATGHETGIKNNWTQTDETNSGTKANLEIQNSSVTLTGSTKGDLCIGNAANIVVDAASTLKSDTQDGNTAVLEFDLDGGTGVTNPIIRKNGETVNLDDYVPTRDGYTFDGWYQGDTKMEGEITLSGRVKLTARWTAIYVPVYIPTYSVTASAAANGTVTVTPKNAAAGVTVAITTAPKQGYVLAALTVLDQRGNVIPLTDRGNGTYSFQMPAGNITIQASFAPEKTVEDYFVDVPADQYYYDAVLWAVTNGITGGVDENHFGPDQNCQRAQLAAFLYRYAQSQGKGFTGAWMFQLPFGDVPEWCYESVAWCYMNEIVTGYGDALFGSGDDITREQVVTILYRFAVQALGMDAVTMQELVSGYGDAGEVSDYAIPAMNWALASGIVQGADGDLMPGQSCTRAEIVTMLYRLLGE